MIHKTKLIFHLIFLISMLSRGTVQAMISSPSPKSLVAPVFQELFQAQLTQTSDNYFSIVTRDIVRLVTEYLPTAADITTAQVAIATATDLDQALSNLNDMGPRAYSVSSNASQILQQKFGNHIDQLDANGFSPLHQQACLGNPVNVLLLWEAGANINLATEWGSTPLYFAARNGHTELARLLIAANANINQMGNCHSESPLWRAAHNYRPEVVKLLLAAGADINQANSDGTTPLGIAAFSGFNQIVELLIEGQANVNQCDYFGISPLWKASRNGCFEVVKLLLAAGADRSKPCEGKTLLEAAKSRGHHKIVALLEGKP